MTTTDKKVIKYIGHRTDGNPLLGGNMIRIVHGYKCAVCDSNDTHTERCLTCRW